MTKLTLESLVQKGAAGASVSPAIVESRTAPPGGHGYWKAMTVKLNRQQYNALKILGVEQNRTSQDCISEAIDYWIAAQNRE